MELNLRKRLSSKFYLFSIGLFATLAGILGFQYLLQNFFSLNPLIALFISYFVIVFCRSLYEQTLIYELKITQIKFENNFALAVISSSILTVLYYFLRAPLGEWGIPLTVLISFKVISQIKKVLWPTTAILKSDFFELYFKKLEQFIYGFYGFFFGLAIITYQIIKHTDITYFYHAFAVALFISLLAQQIYDLIKVYEIQATTKTLTMLFLSSLIFTLLITAITFGLMQGLGFGGKPSTIIGIIVLKLFQPLVFNKIAIK